MDGMGMAYPRSLRVALRCNLVLAISDSNSDFFSSWFSLSSGWRGGVFDRHFDGFRLVLVW